MMGASGVQLGTRFAVSEESIAHPNFKQAFIKAASKDAMPTAQFDPRVPVIPVRSITNKGVEDFTTLQLGLIAQMQRGALTAREAAMQLEEFWIGGLRKAVIDGDIEHGSLMAGQSVGIVSKVQSVREIIQDMVERGIRESDRILGLIDITD